MSSAGGLDIFRVASCLAGTGLAWTTRTCGSMGTRPFSPRASRRGRRGLLVPLPFPPPPTPTTPTPPEAAESCSALQGPIPQILDIFRYLKRYPQVYNLSEDPAARQQLPEAVPARLDALQGPVRHLRPARRVAGGGLLTVRREGREGSLFASGLALRSQGSLT